MSEIVRIEPPPEYNCQPPEFYWDVPGKEHNALCACTRCWETKRKGVPLEKWPGVVVVPFEVKDVSRRTEPRAVLEYEGVRVELTLTFVHNLVGAVIDRDSSFGDSLSMLSNALGEIERRMWRTLEEKRSVTAARQPEVTP